MKDSINGLILVVVSICMVFILTSLVGMAIEPTNSEEFLEIIAVNSMGITALVVISALCNVICNNKKTQRSSDVFSS